MRSNILKITNSKKAQLKRRSKQLHYLQKRADNAYKKKNLELWEAFQICIHFQEQKIINLICQLGRIEEILRDLERLKQN